MNAAHLADKHEPIAIIGIGLRFPGGNETLDGFEQFLREGGSGMRSPEDRWDVTAFTSDDPDERGKIRAARCGFLDKIDEFDAQFFSISPIEASNTDPQQRILLETAWEALENANISPADLRHSNGGVYVGASSIDYALELDSVRYEDLDGHLAAGITTFPMSGRLSYFLGWNGPSLSADTACASSLTALHLAADGLRNRECDIALCGAVNAIHHPRILVMFSHGQMLAADGRCKTFDEAADGYARAEGCGVLVLKRLSDAERAGDNILALVRGTAIGQDGASAGLTVPNGTAQETVMRTALANAGLLPADIQYVEAHGTGTPLGDPIEMSAISGLFMKSHTKVNPLVVGSVKTNLGHMEPAAGLGGVVKTVLQMRSGTIFPHVNLLNLSGRIPWDDIPVTVPTRCLPWQAPTRRAVINSFGFAGAIASAVIEEAPTAPARETVPDQGGHILTVSAKTRRSLRAQVERYQGYLERNPDVLARDICYTSNVGRMHFPLRLAGLVTSREDLADLLTRQLAQLDKGSGSQGDIRKVAFLFTGQGSQYPGMGSTLYRRYPVFRDMVDECDRLFAVHLGRSIRDIMFGADDSGDAVHQTEYTQPALFTLEYALAKLWMSWGARPSVMIGHSIGEIAAAAVADVFSLADATFLVATRGRLMQSVRAAGGMAAVAAPAHDIAPFLDMHPDLAIAAINSPSQCVVSGGSQSLAEVMATLRDKGLTVKALEVSHAFHSPLMAQAAAEFGNALAGITFREPALTLISNVTGKVAGRSELSTPEYWARHIMEPVNFEAGMRTIDRRGKHAFVEIGPSRALIAMAQHCVSSPDHRWLRSLDPADADGTAIVESVARMYTAGLAVNWAGFHKGREGRKVVLPSYAFDRKRYWLPQIGSRHGVGGAIAAGQAHHPLLGGETTAPDQLTCGIREFSARISASEPGYLADHVVAGRTVFPGTGYLEIILALQDAVYGDTRRPILDLVIHEPLFLPDDERVRIRTRMRRQQDGGAAVEILTQISGDDGVIERCHAGATIGACPMPSDTLSEAGQILRTLDAEAAEPQEVLSDEQVYAAYAGAGLKYGPAFRRMRSVTRHANGLAVGELHGSDAGLAEFMPPMVVDAAAHAFAAVGNDGNSYLPICYSQFRMFRKPKAQDARVLLRIGEPASDDVDISIDFLLLEYDQPVFEFCGLGMKKVASGSGQASRSLVHELRWLKRSLVGQPADEACHVLAVHADPACSAGLAGQAGEAGVRVSFAATGAAAGALLGAQPVTDVCWFWQKPPAARSGLAALQEECEQNHGDLLDLLAVLRDAGQAVRLWLVTERGQWLPGDENGDTRLGAERTADPPAAAALWGFGHTLLNEQPAYRVTLADLPGDADGYRSLLAEVRARGSGEFQVAYRSGHRHVRRLLPVDIAARDGEEGNAELAVREYGQFSGIELRPVADLAPQGDEVQVQVRAAGLNFKDVLNALGMLKDFGDQPLGFEAAGTVVAVGPQASHQVGDDVVVNYLACMRRRVNVPSPVVVRKPANVSFAEAAGLAAVYVTAYYALHTLARLKPGDKILIHAAAGGVGQAAVQLAQAAGAEVFATASPHKWPVLRAQGVRHIMNSRTLDFADEIMRLTGGTGVDVVLNSLNKDYISAGMRTLAEHGRFIEMGKVGAWTPEQVSETRPDVSYHNFDLSDMPLDEAMAITSEILRKVIGQVERGELTPITTTVYSLQETEEAFGVLSRGANIGKLVISFDDTMAAPARPVSISPDRTYLITGGMGGLGLATAGKLADLGARHIVLLGRSASRIGADAGLVAKLREKAEVMVYQADIGEADDMSRLVAALREMPHPLGGIVHAAGSLADAPVEGQTWDTINAVYQAKVYGSWLLHDAARLFPDLEFMVGYSSGAPVVGAPGQANYSGANAYLDNLMLWRAGHGLPGLTINWGPWGEVGMSARSSDQVIRRWETEGIRLTSPATGMAALVALLGRPLAQAVVGECDWDRFAASKPVVNALYERLVRPRSAEGGGSLDLAALQAVAPTERTAAIAGLIRQKVAKVLHLDDADGVDADTEFVRLGLDSLMAVELKNSLEAALRIPLASSIVFEQPTTELLAEFLGEQLALEPAR